jgi:hypothetical protein
MTEPLEDGALQPTDSCEFWLDVTVTPVGAPGMAAGVPVPAEEAADAPTTFVAVTVTLYVEPFVTPVSVQVVAGGVAVHVRVGWPLDVPVTV